MRSLQIPLLLALTLLFTGAPALADVYDDAVTNPYRPAADRERDADTKPAELMRFAGVKAGDTVLDMFAGGGYYSELLGYVVGSQGTVLMHNNLAYQGFAGEAIEKRLADGRLSNVVGLFAELEDMGVAAGSVDVIWISMAYHDVYYVADEWTVTPDTFFPALQSLLKPDGKIIVIDHMGTVGTGSSLGNTLHRIDPEYTQADFAAHGFRLAEQSDVLLNPEDDLKISVFDPAIQGKTSKFIYKFVRQ
ncbi:MAG: class I SAM-dependent methyltransferase [Pseudomonadales bacterium]|nr:class I SAM-dependent methyltransferase [Pseudomonadales bacterium]